MISLNAFPCHAADWMEIKTNNMVVITPKMNLLQIPIIDQFYVPPSDPGALARATEFAQEKGLLNPRKTIATKVKAPINTGRQNLGAQCC